MPSPFRILVPTLVLASLAVALPSTTACSAVEQAWVRPDYAAVDRTETLRLAVVTAPLPEGRESVGRLWSLVARRWVNRHRDFIAKVDVAAEGLPDTVCEGDVEGVLHLRPTVARGPRAVRAEVSAVLWRCGDGVTLWRADAAGSWDLVEPELRAPAAAYAEQLGAEVRPYVPATVHLLRATLETLPHPELVRDEDVREKIELGE